MQVASEAEAEMPTIWTWAELVRELELIAAQPMLPGLESSGAMRNEKRTIHEQTGECP